MNSERAMAEKEPREVCLQCRRPKRVCYCRHITKLETKTRIVLLQHPRERDVPIGTARMASLCLPNAELHIGVRFSGTRALREALGDPSRPAALLYPGPGAIDISKDPPKGPITLVVVDGTWSQAKKLVRENPEIAALPRLAFAPKTESEYRIRKEPQEDYVSTIEALMFTLSVLEGDETRFRELLTPFRAMIDTQIEFIERRDPSAYRHKPKPRKPKPIFAPVPRWIHERRSDLVCVVGEANAWPFRTPNRPPDEIVHCYAKRLSTGETFDFVVAPRNVLEPNTLRHVKIEESVLRSGASVETLRSEWSSFLREGDVLSTWGHYTPNLLKKEGLRLPDARLDLRETARIFTRGKVGTLEEFHARMLPPLEEPFAGRGRAGFRTTLLSEVAEFLAERAAT